ncbi:MAG TPA: alpha/beta hydrolase [Acidimicrobiales bacterium]|nr:alpha/beta hydrolase [Acidimicrobiales bacterium]
MTTLVFVHGLGTGSQAWAPQVTHFGERYQVVTPDLPGFGDTEGEFSFASAENHLATVVDELGSDDVVLVGLSLGALVALHYALRFPDRVKGLVLVAGFASLPEELRNQQAAMIGELEGLPLEAAGVVVEQLTANVPEEFRSDARAALRRFTPSSLATLFREVSNYDTTSACAGFTRPTLVAYGSQDSLNEPLCRDLAQRLPGAVTQVIADAGHVANLDAPAAFDAMLDGFLAILSLRTE